MTAESARRHGAKNIRGLAYVPHSLVLELWENTRKYPCQKWITALHYVPIITSNLWKRIHATFKHRKESQADAKTYC